MKDIIDERNKREKMQKSIIKYWNVRYSPIMLQQNELTDAEKETGEAAAESVKLLGAETAPAQATVMQEDTEVTSGQIDKILHEKSEVIRNIVENKGML